MAWNAVATNPPCIARPQAMREAMRDGGMGHRTHCARVLALLLVAVPALSGCEAMDRMDYLDRFFEPAARPGPVVAMDPVTSPGDYTQVADRSPQPTSVVAMQPITSPGDYAPEPTPDRDAQSASVRAMEPRPNPAPPSAAETEDRTRLLVRENRWLTRFWEELTPDQRALVERRLQRGNMRLAVRNAEPAAAWDPMGLADRVGLVFGRGAPSERPTPPERRSTPTLAGKS